MRKIFFSSALMAGLMLISSCQKEQVATSNDELQRQNDSLMQVNAQTKAEYDEMLQLINEVQTGFDQIKSSENYLVVQQNATGEMNKSVREKIADDMTLISKTLQSNKDKINKLQSQLKKSKNKSAQMQETINKLNAMIEERAKMISELQSELAKRDVRIAELDDAVTALSQMNTVQSEVINDQDKTMNTVYYAFGTTKELKAQNIIASRGKNLLKGDFNKSYFTKTDLRNLKSIPLGVKKAKLLTTHPEGSYTMQKDENKVITLEINNPEKFWSTSKYLVIEVD
ncbi:MAG: hypothetical protein RR293_05855 [Bacteroidales bacterium]